MSNFEYEMPMTRLKKHSVLSAVIEAGSNGITVRNISEKCNLSIYSVRNWMQHFILKGTVSKDKGRVSKYRYFYTNY